MINILLFLCILVWSIGEGAPEESEKRDDSQMSTLFIEKPQSGSVSVGKCLEAKSKAVPTETETEVEAGKVCTVFVTLSFCPPLKQIVVGCELYSSKTKKTVQREAKPNSLIQDKLKI